MVGENEQEAGLLQSEREGGEGKIDLQKRLVVPLMGAEAVSQSAQPNEIPSVNATQSKFFFLLFFILRTFLAEREALDKINKQKKQRIFLNENYPQRRGNTSSLVTRNRRKGISTPTPFPFSTFFYIFLQWCLRCPYFILFVVSEASF